MQAVVRGMAQAGRSKVFVTRNVPQQAVDMLKIRCEVSGWWSDSAIPRPELEKGVSDADALFCLLTDQVDKELLDKVGMESFEGTTKAPKLRVIGTMSVGSDHIDLHACRKRKIKVGYTPDVLTEATAELTVALLLATSRRLLEANRAVYSGAWGTWSPLWMCGTGLSGSTIGILGLGRIGASVAEKLKAFRPARILYHGPTAKPEVASPLNAEYAETAEALVRESDVVLATCPLNDATKGLFDSDLFKAMKKGAVFVNTSRGGVVDQEALYEALKSGHLGAAGLDVTTPEPLPTDHPLLALPNCVILPHIGSATVGTRTEMATLTAANIIAGLDDTKMPAPLLHGQILV